MAEAQFASEPTARNSKRLPEKANGEVRLRSVLSVSYTHLDVYKRQLKLNSYNASTNGTTLINHGTIEVENIDGNNNTNIKRLLSESWKITIWYACYGKYFRSYLQRIDG